ncbi:MAG: hypothetical protein M3044_17660 [Thermoproteota archaeon]|nr:hypothetical protein [Thermoproteota archaeon]
MITLISGKLSEKREYGNVIPFRKAFIRSFPKQEKMTLDITESFRRYKQVIIIVVAAAAISTFMLPLTDVNGQTLARSKVLSGRAITSNDLFPNGNYGHGSTGTNNVGNFDHGTNINGKTLGNHNSGITTNGIVAGNNLHGTVNNGMVAGNGDTGTVTNGNALGNGDTGTVTNGNALGNGDSGTLTNGNAIGNGQHIGPRENPQASPPPASPPTAQP